MAKKITKKEAATGNQAEGEGQISVKKSVSKLKVHKVPAAKAKSKDFWDELFE